jgi:hypothetical protein
LHVAGRRRAQGGEEVQDVAEEVAEEVEGSGIKRER